MAVKTRFAPSPTGELHLGNVRTALFNALLAGRDGGTFLLRIEDTDVQRSEQAHRQALQADLGWLGLSWQEGPDVDGDAGPYLQSQRSEIYQPYYDELLRRDLAYPCFCSEESLRLARKAQIAAGQPPRYPGTCASLSPDEIAARRAEGYAAALRFRVPRGRVIAFDDAVRGSQRFASDDMGDFIIQRADASPGFFFSNALDDALMGVSHVLRGEDHLANTPRQLLLLEALGLPAPVYGHIAMIVADDGSPLSKRHAASGLRVLREQGYLPEAIVNHLARLGHTYPDDRLMTLDELAAGFALERLGRAPARHDETQLQHWQREAVAAADADRLWRWMAEAEPGLAELVPGGRVEDFVAAVRDNIAMPSQALAWARCLFAGAASPGPEAKAAIRAAGAGFYDTALGSLSPGRDFREYSRALSRGTGAKGKGLYQPLRAALTGSLAGPELARIWGLLDEATRRDRLVAARDLAEG